MLSAATLTYLSPQPDIDDQQIDVLVEYAATRRPDAWTAIKLMHECKQDSMIPNYLLRLQDERLNALGNILPHLWRRVDAYNLQLQKRQAETDTQPEAMQQQIDLQQMKERVTSWMRKQSREVCTSIICRAIEATVKANLVRCKQDLSGLKRLICDEGQWISGLTNTAFAQMLDEHCNIDKTLIPTESSLKVLAFGTSQFPAWKVASYDPMQLKSLVQMARHFLQHIDRQVQQSLKLALNNPIAV